MSVEKIDNSSLADLFTKTMSALDNLDSASETDLKDIVVQLHYITFRPDVCPAMSSSMVRMTAEMVMDYFRTPKRTRSDSFKSQLLHDLDACISQLRSDPPPSNNQQEETTMNKSHLPQLFAQASAHIQAIHYKKTSIHDGAAIVRDLSILPIADGMVPGMSLRAVRDLIARTIGAIETPSDLSEEEIKHLAEDLTITVASMRGTKTPTQSAKDPKVVNLVLVGVNAASVCNLVSMPMSGLLDEMIARGGRVYDLLPKDTSAEDIIAECQALVDAMTSPDRHPSTQFIFAKYKADGTLIEQSVAKAIDTALQVSTTLSVHQQRMIVIRDRIASDAEVSTVYETILAGMLSNLPGPAMDRITLANIRTSLMSAVNIVNTVAMTVNRLESSQNSAFGGYVRQQPVINPGMPRFPAAGPGMPYAPNEFNSEFHPWAGMPSRFPPARRGQMYQDPFQGLNMQQFDTGLSGPPFGAGVRFGQPMAGWQCNAGARPFPEETDEQYYSHPDLGTWQRPVPGGAGWEAYQRSGTFAPSSRNTNMAIPIVNQPLNLDESNMLNLYEGTLVIHVMGSEMGQDFSDLYGRMFQTRMPKATILHRYYDVMEMESSISDQTEGVLKEIHTHEHVHLITTPRGISEEVGSMSRNAADAIEALLKSKNHPVRYVMGTLVGTKPVFERMAAELLHQLHPRARLAKMQMEENDRRQILESVDIVFHVIGSEHHATANSTVTRLEAMLPNAKFDVHVYHPSTPTILQSDAIDAISEHSGDHEIHFVVSNERNITKDGYPQPPKVVFEEIKKANRTVGYIHITDLAEPKLAYEHVNAGLLELKHHPKQ